MPEPVVKEKAKVSRIRQALHKHQDKYYQDTIVKPKEDFWENPHSSLDKPNTKKRKK